MCPERENNIVLNLKVRRISQIVKMEELLNLPCSLFRKVNRLILLAYHEITGLLKACAHENVHL